MTTRPITVTPSFDRVYTFTIGTNFDLPDKATKAILSYIAIIIGNEAQVGYEMNISSSKRGRVRKQK